MSESNSPSIASSIASSYASYSYIINQLGLTGSKWSKNVIISYNCKDGFKCTLEEVLFKIFDNDTEDDLIIDSSVYSSSMNSSCSISIPFISHKLLIIKTQAGYYYSIEKMNIGIIVQRSKNLEDVKQLEGKYRKVDIENTENVQISLRRLLGIIYNRKSNETYNIVTNNCIDFVNDMLNELLSLQWHKYVFVSFDCKEFKNYFVEEVLREIFKNDKDNDLIIESTEYTSNKTSHSNNLLVIKTQSGYYSIEKCNNGIYLQRSKNLEKVLKYQGNEREYFKGKSETVKESLRELINIIYNKEQTNESDNNVTRSNCRNFVVSVVKELLLVQWSKCIFISFDCKKFENRSLDEVIDNIFNNDNDDDECIEFSLYQYERIFFQKLLIIKTKSRDYYSIEKMADGIYIQRSRNLEDVLKFGGNSREIKKDKSETINESLRNILNKIYNEITEESYSDATSNCINHVDFIIKEFRETLQ